MLPASAIRPYTFAKIHGIYSGFRSPETLLYLLQSGSQEKALQDLPIDIGIIRENDQLSREFRLHRAFFALISRLIPAKGAAGRFFRTLLSEYELRNVSFWLKNGRLHKGEFYPLPEQDWPLTGILHRTAPEIGRKVLEKTPYADTAGEFYRDEDPVRLDRSLEQLWFRRLYDSARALPANDRKPITFLLERFLDIRITLQALRLSRIYGKSPSESTEPLFFISDPARKSLESGLARSPEDLTGLFPASCRTGIREILNRFPSDGSREPSSLTDLDIAGARYLHHLFRKHFYLNHRSLGPLFCFYFLLKQEIMNTALLCNSIRFEAGTDDFRRELIH